MTATLSRPRAGALPNRYANLTWGGYARISEDPHDERAGVTRQVEDITDAILSLDAVPPDADDARMVVENDTGAFKKRRVTITDQYGETRDAYRVIRPKWGAALRDLRAGKINALMVYDLDRLARDPYDLEDAIEAVEFYGATIMSATAAEIDLMTESGRLTARIMVTVANKASADTSRRVKRGHLQLARSGVVKHGARAFGWQADKITIDPVEAALIKKAATDIIDGAGLRTVTREWNEAGVTTVRGNTWDHRSVRQVLRSPRLAGWRIHQGKIATDEAGQQVRGNWETILDQDVFDRLQKALAGRPNVKGGRRGSRKYLLSGVVRCGVCGARMYGSATPTGHAYNCRVTDGIGVAGGHHVTIQGLMTDTEVIAVVQRKLQKASDLPAPPQPEFPGAARLEVIANKIREVMEAYNADQMSGAIAFPQVQSLEKEQAELKAERDKMIAATTGPRVSKVDPKGFMDLDVDKQRAVVEQVLDAVVIAPAKAKGARWTTDRISYVWRQPS